MSRSTWGGVRVLVTGAGGFIGSHLCDRLVQLGADVTAFLHYNSRGDIGALEYSPHTLRSQLRLAWGDLRDADSVRREIQGREIVFHLGALIAIPYSYAAPRQYVETNVIGTLNVLQAATENDVQVVHTSTSEVYGSARSIPIGEEHPLQAQSPYAASKVAADKLAESFFRSYRTRVATIRPFNAFGPRQSLRAVLPTIIMQAVVGDVLRIGSRTPVRDLNFVDDLIDAYIAIATSQTSIGQVVNVGTGEGRSVDDLIAAVEQELNKRIDVVVESTRLRPEASEVDRLIADCRRADSVLGWRPKTPFKDGLKVTIEWFAEHRRRFEPQLHQMRL